MLLLRCDAILFLHLFLLQFLAGIRSKGTPLYSNFKLFMPLIIIFVKVEKKMNKASEKRECLHFHSPTIRGLKVSLLSRPTFGDYVTRISVPPWYGQAHYYPVCSNSATWVWLCGAVAPRTHQRCKAMLYTTPLPELRVTNYCQHHLAMCPALRGRPPLQSSAVPPRSLLVQSMLHHPVCPLNLPLVSSHHHPHLHLLPLQ